VKSGVGEVVRLISLPSQAAARAFHKPIGLLWIDGDHSLEGVTGDFQSWERHFTESTILAFDDATDPAVGPFHLIQKLTQSGGWVESGGCGKVRVLKRCA
jgi:hypothetical protein